MDSSDRDDSYEALVEGLGKDALDLINRKQKVNELAAKEIVDLKIKVEQQKAEIEILTGERDCLAKMEHDNLYEQTQKIRKAKSEAIKEFANNVKKHFFQVELVEYIDGLVEEVEMGLR
jgi:hypothetical protein